MRTLIASVSVVLAVLYAAAAGYFYLQERWARTPFEVSPENFSHLHHPEATLGLVRQELQRNVPAEELPVGLQRLLQQAPSFYQPPLLLALYHANRLEKPAVVRRGFETAIRRFPANGRLHAAYAEWLLAARSDLSAWVAVSDTPNLPADPLPLAESHIRTALQLEPALTWELLTALGRHNIPADRWTHLIPDDEQARRQLVSVLFGAGQDAEALALLREVLARPQEITFLRQATGWALQRGEPGLALEAALKWKEAEETAHHNTFQWALYVSRAHLALDDPDAAYQSFRQALKEIERSSGPSSTPGLELLCAMAYEYLGRGEPVLAESLFAEASTLAPNYAPASLGLARIYRRSGDDAAAMEQYQKVLRLDSDNPEAERELQQLLVTPDPRTSSLR